ncbi:hypothetical protein TZ93_01688 [Streptococcus mitis]|uniref:Uncharacterized protein n=1 Tax=Streptococcus mitis TaxID=28037 RepID=A0A0F2DQP5_STRMT|nr:hypothetical protein TZ93_01688 [Streptococcus mitis]
MKSIYTSQKDMLEICQDGDKYFLRYPTFNITMPEVVQEIPKEAADSYMSGEHTGKELMNYADYGFWKSKKQYTQDESYKLFIENHSSFILKNPGNTRRLFTAEEFRQIVTKAIVSELEPSELDAIGIVDSHLELLLVDPVGWEEEIEAVHLEILQEKINNYIHFLESKQYVERYGDKFDKKVIHITFQYSPSDNGLAFLAAVQKVLQNSDMSLKVELPDDDIFSDKENISEDSNHPNQDQEKLSKERYLQIKKEYKMRLVLVIVLFVLLSILSIVLIVNSNRIIPLGATAMATVVPFNQFFLVPLWQEKKAIEEVHPEWKALSTSVVKVPSDESDKKIFPFIASVLALFFTFSMLYRPVKENPKIPTIEEIKNIPKIDSNYIPKSKKSSNSEPTSTTTTSDLNETSSTEESTQSQTSSKESQNYPYHISGMELRGSLIKHLKISMRNGRMNKI